MIATRQDDVIRLRLCGMDADAVADHLNLPLSLVQSDWAEFEGHQQDHLPATA